MAEKEKEHRTQALQCLQAAGTPSGPLHLLGQPPIWGGGAPTKGIRREDWLNLSGSFVIMMGGLANDFSQISSVTKDTWGG